MTTTLDKIKEDWENRISERSPHGFWWSNGNLKVDALWKWIEQSIIQAQQDKVEEIVKLVKRMTRKCPYMPVRDKEVYIELNEFLKLLRQSKEDNK